jgi:hypothetical protein
MTSNQDFENIGRSAKDEEMFAFEQIEWDFNTVFQELAKDKSLEHFKSEYAKLFK